MLELLNNTQLKELILAKKTECFSTVEVSKLLNFSQYRYFLNFEEKNQLKSRYTLMNLLIDLKWIDSISRQPIVEKVEEGLVINLRSCYKTKSYPNQDSLVIHTSPAVTKKGFNFLKEFLNNCKKSYKVKQDSSLSAEKITLYSRMKSDIENSYTKEELLNKYKSLYSAITIYTYYNKILKLKKEGK